MRIGRPHLRVVIFLTGCDFPHREARGQILMSAPKRRGATAMTFFPLSLTALAILAIAALAGRVKGELEWKPIYLSSCR